MKEKIKQSIRFSILFTVFIALTFMAASTAFSQYSYYYGKNKVPKQKYKWNHVETEHFKIYYYTEKETLIKKLAAASENSYNQISEYLNVKVKKKIPLIFYSTHIDFEMNNIAGYLPPQVVAFAESTAYRVVIQGDEPFEDLVRTITHELAHIFEYTIMGNKVRFFRPPLWVTEGFSEFVTRDWDQFSLLTVRDSVMSGDIPVMDKNGNLNARSYNSRSPYDFGHAVYEFLDEKYGKRGVKKMLYSLRGGSMFRPSHNPLKVFDLSPKVFNFEFGKYLRKRFEKYKYKENPEDYSYIIGPDFPYVYSFSHQVSPSGELLAVLTVNIKRRLLQIVLISMEDGKVVKNLTPGIPSDYDWINLNFNPTDGASFGWNKESNKIAFFVRKDIFNNYLILVDVLKGEVVRKIAIESVQRPSCPVFDPKNPDRLYFVGQESTNGYIYSIDLNSEKINKLTEGLLFPHGFDIDQDGSRIVFSALKDGYHKLYLGMVDKPEMAKQITFGEYNDITPSFSSDGKKIYYSSDELDSYNIYALDLEAKMLYRYSDVMTGNFFPVEIPGDEKNLVMSTYHQGTFTLFKKDITTPQHKRSVVFKDLDTEALVKKAAEIPDVEVKFLGKYRPFSKLYIRSLPPLSISIGTDGGFFGYSYLSLTDLLGDHVLSLMISTYYGYRSYHATYLNQSRRLQLYTHLYAYQDVYYYNGYVSNDYLTLRSQYGGDFGFFYPFSLYTRAEATASIYKQNENFDEFYYGGQLPYGQFFDGWALPLRLSLVGETTTFSNETVGPLRGQTFRLSFAKYIKVGDNFLDAYTIEADYRKYLSISKNALFAFRLYGFTSGGDNPLLYYTGGNNTLRSVGYRRAAGNNLFVFNAEFRFPLVQAALTPIGIVGPVRGVFFFDVGGIWFKGEDFNFFRKDEDGDTQFRLEDAISSYGFGLEFFLFGYPMHVEWVWRSDWKHRDYQGVNFWVGFDF